MFGFKKDLEKANTKELKADIDRLFIIQNIVNQIARKDSFKDIAIETLNQIEQKMGYSAASISIVDIPKGTIQLKFLSTSLISKLSTKFILSKDTFAELKINKEKLTYTEQAALERKVIIDKNISNFIVPPLSLNVANFLQFVTGIKCMVALPIISRDKVIGILNFSMNKEKEEISINELKTLELFIDQVGVIMDNAIKYNEINNFNSNLKQEIDKATVNLENKYKDLQSVYNLTTQVGQTLDLKKVAQTAVDALPQDKSMIGAILTMYDKNAQTVTPIAVTQNAISEQVKSLVGEFDKYVLDATSDIYKNNPSVQSIIQNKIISTSDLHSLLSPPIPSQLVPVIAKILNIKSVVVFPLHAREKIIGAIEYFLKEKSYEELDINEKQLFATYTYQISSALDNSFLYQESQLVSHNLEKALTQVQDARKHEQDMIDILGHELRTPATVCKGNIELLIGRVKNNTNIEDNLEKDLLARLSSAYSAIVQETGLITELLTATKLDSGQLVVTTEPIDLYEIAQNGYRNFVDTAKKAKLELNLIEPTEKIPMTTGDKVRMGEVVDNLISNAVKYTKSGHIDISLHADENNVYFSVKDTGNGLPKGEIPLLFQKFKRVNNYIKGSTDIVRPNGTGLGLYVAKGIIEAHKGKIWVESDGEGKGSTFSFFIPIIQLTDKISQAGEEIDMFKKLGLKAGENLNVQS